MCFAVYRADAELDDRAHEMFGVEAWPELLWRARLLRDRVPRGQRAAIAAAWELDEAERENQILWQIARSHAWQGWYEACGEDWRNRNGALRALETKSVLSVAGLGGRDV